jgi:type VI secretion system protein ImpJ
MFLRPQHFQAADRYWSELLATSQQWSDQYNYGLRRIEISREALGNFHFEVTLCHARLRDGTLLALEGPNDLRRVDLKAAFARQAEVMLYLGVPKLAMGRRNVQRENGSPKDTGQDNLYRFAGRTLSIEDQTTGGSDQEIEFLAMNCRLLTSLDDLAGFETVPLGRVKRAGAEEATPEVDVDYIPPLLAVDAWNPLAIDLVRGIYDKIGQKIEVLRQRASHRKMSLSSHQPGDLEDLLMLTALNSIFAVLHCQTFAQGIHPYVVYQELCRAVGALAIFGDTRTVGEIPAYDHDDLSRIFRWIKLRLDQLLEVRQALEYEQRYFVGVDQGMQVSIEPAWLHPTWDWYVGVSAQNLSDAECREMLRPGKLDWKMASSQQIELVFRHGLPGIEQVELTQVPRALPPHGWVYYQVQRGNSAWRDVLASQTLALRFKEELIGNLAKLRGQRQLEVVLPHKRALMEFALFAVPKVTK